LNYFLSSRLSSRLCDFAVVPGLENEFEDSMLHVLKKAIDEMTELLPKIEKLEGPLLMLGEAMLACWVRKGKVLTCGNGGSCADAAHLAEELSVRFKKDRRALAAFALADASAITCCGNDYGYDRIFSRQVEALGNAGDILIVFTTSGNSESCIQAVNVAKNQGLTTVAFLGKDGGKLKGVCDIELIIPSSSTARIQEGHKILFHSLCEWIDQQVGD
jgi:D-sedoheptulose 7-phosphate isomerase